MIQRELCETITRQVAVMREVLASLHQERRALLYNDCKGLALIGLERNYLRVDMRRLRLLMQRQMDQLQEPIESTEFFTLKDQLMCLGGKIQSVRKGNLSLKKGHMLRVAPEMVKPKRGMLKLMQIERG